MHFDNLKVDVKELAGWLIVSGIFMEKYYEMFILFSTLILLWKLYRRLYLKKQIAYFLLILFFSSAFTIFALDYRYDKFLQQFVLLSYFLVCYSAIFYCFRDDLFSLFQKYLTLSYIVAFLGLIQFVTYYIYGVDIFSFMYGRIPAEATAGVLRITSIIDEPSYLSTLLTPALIYHLLNGFFPISIKKIILFFSVLLTFSTITYVIIAIYFVYKYIYLKNRYLFYSLFCLFFSFLIMNDNSCSDSNLREDDRAFSAIFRKLQDTYDGFMTMDPEVFETLNMSSYATMVNLWVSTNAPSRIIGTGLGTHEQNYYRQYKSNSIFYGLNAPDGYSLINRLYSEFGILGCIFFCIWVCKNYNKNNSINVAIFFLILTLSIRGGNYVRYGFVFWMFFYYYLSIPILAQRKI